MNQTAAAPMSAPTVLVPKKKHRNLAQGVVEAFTNSIQAGTLKPGEKLPTESVIMEIHGVSRTVVREAISHLQAAGLVQTRHGIGTFVLEPQPANLRISADTIRTIGDVLAILELRISLETEAAWLAATRRTEEQVQEMGAVLKRIQHSQGRPGSVESDVAFHLLIAQATGNRYFVDILSDLGNTIIPRARVNSAQLAHDDPAVYLERLNREHDDIYNAILRKDAEAARAAMRTHLSNSRERLRRAQEGIAAGQTA
ncbi:FadR/GntR family transcriptional regulator [Duganella violaceipulchra]|uniref:FadR family transcriptional regulator n=1 Tax=Duganella violaceipulchra TaxID=2849652 RepID=A0AA41L8M0_9BURK|nr:FadR/GntR family transcriptional regulator [Duganella violaceicalia]MBV6322345.1 FadR family transcriptional regulator [Duganella violaceicalia]MCP2011492.1 DNA-binding FadR family transcriptional regulator [Duganella violaceicalia]